MNFTENLHWRYATKLMNNAVVPSEKLDAILQATSLSASSYGLQPYTILVVSNPDIKAKLQEAAYGQPQLTTSSHVLVFCVKEKIETSDIETYIELVATTRNMDISLLDGFKGMMQGAVGTLPAEQQQIWSTKQAYIALGTALLAAAEQQVDACPMEGFNAIQFDEILGLKEKGLKSVVILPLGYRSPDDASAHYKKVRKSTETLFEIVD